MKSSVLRIIPFRRLWLGQAVSQFGDALYFLILAFMVGKLTGSAAMVGYIGALKALPYLLLGPYAGVLADRIDRKIIMLASDLLSATVLLGLGVVVWLAPAPPIWTIFVAASSLAIINVFFLPAKSAAIPNLVPTDRLLEANSLSSATQSMMPLIGLALSATALGAIYAIYPDYFFLTAIVVNAASFLYSAYCISTLPSIRPDRAGQPKQRVLDDTRAGIAFIWKNHVLKVTLLLSMLLNLFVAPFMVVYIAANNLWFGGKFSTLAWFEFSFTLGMVIGSIIVGRLSIRRPGFAFCIGLVVVGASIAMLAIGPYFWNMVLWNLVAGLAIPYASVPINTYFQLVVPDSFRGRVNSAITMAAMGVMPLGMMLAGIVTAKIGVVLMFIVMGGGMVAASAFGLIDGPFRNATMPGDSEHPAPEPVQALTTNLEPAS